MNQALPKFDYPRSDASPWLGEARRKIAELAQLPEGWDSYESHPIQPAALQQSASVLEFLGKFDLPSPQIFPVPGGGIQMEWQNVRCAMELEIFPNGAMAFLIEDAEGEMREGEFAASYEEQLYRLVFWFDRQKGSIVEL